MKIKLHEIFLLESLSSFRRLLSAEADDGVVDLTHFTSLPRAKNAARQGLRPSEDTKNPEWTGAYCVVGHPNTAIHSWDEREDWQDAAISVKLPVQNLEKVFPDYHHYDRPDERVPHPDKTAKDAISRYPETIGQPVYVKGGIAPSMLSVFKIVKKGEAR